MKNYSLNKKQIKDLRNLISRHMHLILEDKNQANKVFEKIKKYGVKTMFEAIELYKANRKNILCKL